MTVEKRGKVTPDEELSKSLCELYDEVATMQRSSGQVRVLSNKNVKHKGPEAGKKASVAGL